MDFWRPSCVSLPNAGVTDQSPHAWLVVFAVLAADCGATLVLEALTLSFFPSLEIKIHSLTVLGVGKGGVMGCWGWCLAGKGSSAKHKPRASEEMAVAWCEWEVQDGGWRWRYRWGKLGRVRS